MPHAAGMDAAKLAAQVLSHPSLLHLPENTLQRNYDAVLADMEAKEEAGRLLVRRHPDVLLAAEGRVGLNLQTLQQLGATWKTAVTALECNGQLAKLNLQSPKFAARVAFWQQTYGLSAGMLACGIRRAAVIDIEVPCSSIKNSSFVCCELQMRLCCAAGAGYVAACAPWRPAWHTTNTRSRGRTCQAPSSLPGKMGSSASTQG